MSPFVDVDGKVALVGALFDVAGVEAKDAGSVGGAEVDGGVAAVVVAVNGHVYLAALGGEFDGFVVADVLFYQRGVVAVDVIGAKVERDVDEVDGVVGEEPYLHAVGRGVEGEE